MVSHLTTIRFLVNHRVDDAAQTAYIAGQICKMTGDSARHFIRRGLAEKMSAAEIAAEKAEARAAKEAAEAEAAQKVAQQEAAEAEAAQKVAQQEAAEAEAAAEQAKKARAKARKNKAGRTKK